MRSQISGPAGPAGSDTSADGQSKIAIVQHRAYVGGRIQVPVLTHSAWSHFPGVPPIPAAAGAVCRPSLPNLSRDAFPCARVQGPASSDDGCQDHRAKHTKPAALPLLLSRPPHMPTTGCRRQVALAVCWMLSSLPVQSTKSLAGAGKCPAERTLRGRRGLWRPPEDPYQGACLQSPARCRVRAQ